jgi:hypothetical protein
MNKYSDPDPGSGIKHPGSATLDWMTAKNMRNLFIVAKAIGTCAWH